MLILNEKIKNLIELLPSKPGCYLMHNENNEIIYIGKAKNLKNRVSQYFLLEHQGKTKAMVSHVDYFETIITDNEKEALILEINLIKKYHPRYNILLQDDKKYPYIAIHNIEHPYVSIERNINNKKCIYFGPYPISNYAYNVVKLINRFYPLRKCKTIPKKPCVYYQMKQCLGPCINKISQEKYNEIIKDIKKVLSSDSNELKEIINKKLKEAMINLDYENAKEYKDILDSLNYILKEQKVELIKENKNIDIISFHYDKEFLSINILYIRNGMLLGKKNIIERYILDINEQISELLIQYYSNNLVPDKIIINNKDIINDLQQIFPSQYIIPKMGKYYDLVNVSFSNAKKDLEEYLSSKIKIDSLSLIEELGELLNIKTPYKIELYDNSHMQGDSAIGAMVTFVNGKKFKNGYRIYNLENKNTKNDLESMEFVLEKRFNKLIKENDNYPNLIILDGGEEQIKVCNKLLTKFSLKIPICGLVKDSHHKSSGLLDSNLNLINLDKKSDLFILLSYMQDEVHRFAITNYRKKAIKNSYNSIFDDIEGLGNKRIEILKNNYENIYQLEEASIEEISQFIPKKIAIDLYNKLHKNQ
ncbi:MAG: excinuclease ABC subunit UvrC [Bacillales bacterium]